MCSKTDVTVPRTDHWWENHWSKTVVWSFEATILPKRLLYWTRLPAISGALKVNRNWTRSLPKILVVYHLQRVFPENPVGEYMEHEFLGHSSGKIPGETELLKRCPFFSARNVPNGYSCSIFPKLSLIPGSGLRGLFAVNRTDLYKWKTLFRNEMKQSWILFTIDSNCELTGFSP